jgi:uroporphyrinogen-III decarboxylase
MASPLEGRNIPIAAQCLDHTPRLAGISSRRFFTHAPTFARTQLLVSEYYGFDAPNTLWDIYNIEAEAMGQKMVFPEHGIPDVDRTVPLIASPSDLDTIRPPDPYASGRMPWVHEVNRTYTEMRGKPAGAFFCAPFSLAANIRGYANLIMDMVERPDFVHRLFRFLCDEVIAPYVESVRQETGIPGLLADGYDAWASPPMVTLDMMDEFVVVYTERLRGHLGPKVVTRGNWGDSRGHDLERFLGQKLRCSPGFLSVLDPDLYEAGPERVKAFAKKHNAFVTAGIDATLLQKGPVDAIAERVKYYIDTMARDGQCIIYLNQIAAETPTDHIHAAVAACRTYGRLPIAENLDGIPFELPTRESFQAFLDGKGERVEG